MAAASVEPVASRSDGRSLAPKFVPQLRNQELGPLDVQIRVSSVRLPGEALAPPEYRGVGGSMPLERPKDGGERLAAMREMIKAWESSSYGTHLMLG
mmetsp:Transcript_38206/g.122876  ORF Transcript_38206/g.122876 Transcript_38206/m.122876 type:complete len:97 (+) Transcript_38206:105-395(+)